MAGTGKPIGSILVAGGGLVAWSAAAAIRKRLPMIDVTVLPTPVDPAAFADAIDCTLPSIVEFHRDIGLGDSNVFLGARSGIRLGTLFDGWAEDQPDYVHAYGECGQPIGASAFHQHWLRAERGDGVAAFESFCTAAVMARAEKYAASADRAAPGVGRFAFGLHIDPARYREMMRAYALHLGATEQPGDIVDVKVESGRIAAVKLADGSELTADLFVDATGPASLLRGALDGDWRDWSRYFLADRVVRAETIPGAAGVLDEAAAVDCGWTWEVRSPARTSSGIVYSSRHLTDDAAAAMLSGADALGEPVRIKPGRWAEPWSGNCVAIGDSAIAIEPLEWTNLHLAHSAIDRVIALMPDTEFSAVELWDYNRQAGAEADRARDFVLAHYAASSRPQPFWTEAAAVPLPESLEHTLTQFRERGRLPYYEEETFSRDSWLAVLLGQGLRPRRLDALVDGVPADEARRHLARIQKVIAEFVDSLPSHSNFIETLRQKVA